MVRAKRDKGKVPRYKIFFGILLLIFMAVLPWITYLKITKLDTGISSVFENYDGYVLNFFIYYKAVAVIVTAVFFIFIMLGENIFPDNIIKNTPIKAKGNRRILICMLAYITAVLLSTALSEHKELAVWGSPSEGEGCFVLIGYMVLCAAAMNYFCYEKTIKYLKYAMTFITIITIILTAVEFFYRPLLMIPAVKNLVASDEYRDLLDGLSTAGYEGYVSLAFYNPNYYGGFCLLLLPFSFLMYMKEKKAGNAVLYGILSAGMMFCIVAAKSSTSFYLAILEMATVMAMCIKMKRKMIGRVLLYTAAAVAAAFALNAASGGRLTDIGKNAATNDSGVNENSNIFRLTDIVMSGNTLRLCTDTEELKIVCGDAYLKLLDTNGELADYQVSREGDITFDDERYSAVTISYINGALTFDLGYDDTINFYIKDNVFYAIGQNGEMLDYVSRENRFGEKLYSLFTGRGYAWINSLPIIKNTVLIGKGAGNFALYFYQKDFVGLLNTHGSSRLIIDKPHNMYIQTLINIGGVGLAAILALFVITAVGYVKCKKSKAVKDSLPWLMLDYTFIAFTAFAVYSVINDSIVTVNPIFWILVGIQLSLQFMLSQSYKDKNTKKAAA